MVAVGEAVMDVEGRLCLAVTDDHPKVHQCGALVEQRFGRLGVRAVEFDHLDARVQQIIEDDLVASVGPLFEVAAQHGVGLQQHIESLGHGVDVNGSFDMCAQTDEILRLGEHLLAAGEFADCR